MKLFIVGLLALLVLVTLGFWRSRRRSARRSAVVDVDTVALGAADSFANHRTGHPDFDAAFSTFMFDYSLESLKLVDEGLENLRNNLSEKADGTRDISSADGDAVMRLVLCAGAYLGVVIQRNSDQSLQWKKFEDLDEQTKQVFGGEKDMSNFLVLCGNESAGLCTLPMNRIGRFLVNGKEDSLYGFATSAVRAVGD